jgi:hypothetical protein
LDKDKCEPCGCREEYWLDGDTDLDRPPPLEPVGKLLIISEKYWNENKRKMYMYILRITLTLHK